MSHFVTRPLEKKKSNGFHTAAVSATLLLRLDAKLTLCRLAPGLIRVNLWTRGSVRIDEPPSVAAAVDGAIEEWVV